MPQSPVGLLSGEKAEPRAEDVCAPRFKARVRMHAWFTARLLPPWGIIKALFRSLGLVISAQRAGYGRCVTGGVVYFTTLYFPAFVSFRRLSRLCLVFCSASAILRLLDAILDMCGCPSEKFRSICSAIDKLDKMQWSEVSQPFSLSHSRDRTRVE